MKDVIVWAKYNLRCCEGCGLNQSTNDADAARQRERTLTATVIGKEAYRQCANSTSDIVRAYNRTCYPWSPLSVTLSLKKSHKS